jgi:transcriptional regulator with XRE-family HTH domain
MTKARDDSRRERAKELARRITLLLDVVAAEGGKPFTYSDISRLLKDRGLELSRARWYYLREGEGHLVSDVPLLEALADIFGVPPSYLLESDPETPSRVEAQLSLLRSMRKQELKDFALRSLSGVYSQESVSALAKLIDTELGDDDEDE